MPKKLNELPPSAGTRWTCLLDSSIWEWTWDEMGVRDAGSNKYKAERAHDFGRNARAYLSRRGYKLTTRITENGIAMQAHHKGEES
jgi:hypothetical protein